MKSKNYSEESEQIASSVRNYQIIDNDRLVYQSTDKDLYFINGEDKEKIASYTYEYEINQKNNYIIWSTENEEYSENEDGDSDDSTTYDLYVQSLNIEGEKVKILSGVNSYFFYEDSILALTGDQLFYVNGANKASKIADGVTGQYWLQKNDAIYYVRGKSDEYLDYTEWVNDPYIDQDYTEPDYFSEDGSWEAWEARESVRDSISEITKYGNESLYCYKDGKETKITDGFNYIDYNYDMVDSDDSFVFFRYNMQLFKKVEIDELVGMEGDYASAYNTAMQKTLETCLYIDGNIIKLQENLSNTSINEESGTGYGILFNNEGDDETSTGVLYSFKATKESEGSVTKITDNVNDIAWTDNNGVYYRKDVNDKGEGTLYFNDKKIEDSVNAVEAIHDGNVIYSINEDSLVSFDGKNNDRIADDVYAYGYYGDGLLILHDYDFHSNNGTLSYYTGKKDAELIDNNVSGFPGSIILDY